MAAQQSVAADGTRGPPLNRDDRRYNDGMCGPRIAMKIRFYIDPQTAAPHIYNPGIDESEVEDVLRNPGEDRPSREGSRVAIGQTKGGRYLRVI